MNGYIDVMQHKIENVKSPTKDLDAVNKKFCDNTYLKLTGGTMQGSVYFGGYLLRGVSDPFFDDSVTHKKYVDSYVEKDKYNHFSESLFWNYYTTHGECLYRIFKGDASEITYDSTTRKVSKLFDQTLSQLDATSSTTTGINKPKLCSKANKINKRYYLEFSGNKELLISDINLNISDNTKNKVHIFIVYMLKSFTVNTYWTRNGLFGHDNKGYDKFVSFWSDGKLIVSGTTGNYITVKKTDYKTKAKPNELNKWICLSVHWDVPGGSNKSSVYCNGKKLVDFTARTSQGSNKMTFGGLNPSSIAPLYGNIAFFCLYKKKDMLHDDIKLHHKVLCNWYAIDHDTIQF